MTPSHRLRIWLTLLKKSHLPLMVHLIGVEQHRLFHLHAHYFFRKSLSFGIENAALSL
jgi:hypothetical protein